MKAFRQIRTNNLELMQVQDAVRDALQEVVTSLNDLADRISSIYRLESEAIANSTNVEFGRLPLARGSYRIRAGYLAEILMTSGTPTTTASTCRMYNQGGQIVLENGSGNPGDGLGAGLALAAADTYRGWAFVQGNIDWPGGEIQARARIVSAGGTVASRNVRDGFIEAIRIR